MILAVSCMDGNKGDENTSITVINVIMVWVPGGSFELGRNLGTEGGANVNPVSNVRLSGFYMGIYPVTQAQYQAVMGRNPSWFTTARGRPPAEGESDQDRPIESVSWYDAVVFCNRLSMAEDLSPAYIIAGSTDPSDWPRVRGPIWDAIEVVPGSNGYRLPTEAQWEHAAKGGNGSPGNFIYPGSNNPDEVAWHSGNSGGRTRQVGSRVPNNLGIYDMGGNVSEWCWDWLGDYMDGTDPSGPVSGTQRVLRGGSYHFSASSARSNWRYRYAPFNTYDYISFRLVRPGIEP